MFSVGVKAFVSEKQRAQLLTEALARQTASLSDRSRQVCSQRYGGFSFAEGS